MKIITLREKILKNHEIMSYICNKVLHLPKKIHKFMRKKIKITRKKDVNLWEKSLKFTRKKIIN